MDKELKEKKRVIERAGRLIATRIENDIHDINYIDSLMDKIMDKVGCYSLKKSKYYHRRRSTAFFEYIVNKVLKGDIKLD